MAEESRGQAPTPPGVNNKYKYIFKGELTVKARTEQEAELLLKLAFESVGVEGDLGAWLVAVGGNQFRYKINGFKFALYGKTFEEVDLKLLKAIKTICVEYNYDPIINEYQPIIPGSPSGAKPLDKIVSKG